MCCVHSLKSDSSLVPIFSSAFALWANAELYILGPSLTCFLPFSGRKFEKFVNIDARTLKCCISHLWTQSSRFRENKIVCMSVSLSVGLIPYRNSANIGR